MSIFSNLNERLERISRRKRPIPRLINHATLVLGTKRFPLATLKRALVTDEDVFVGSLITLWLEFDDGGALRISQQDDVWQALLDALDRDGRFPRSMDWLVETIAAGPRANPRVLLDG